MKELIEKVQDQINIQVMMDIKDRNPKGLLDVYFGTLLNMNAKFGWYDKYQLRQIVGLKILKSYSKRLNTNDNNKLLELMEENDKQMHNSVFETMKYNNNDFDD